MPFLKVRTLTAFAVTYAVFFGHAVFAQDAMMAAVASADNRFEVFLQTRNGIDHFWSNGAGAWLRYGQLYKPASTVATDISSIEGYLRPTIAAARDSLGRICVAWIANGQVYYAAAPTVGGSLNLPGAPVYGAKDVSSLAITMGPENRLVLATLQIDGLAHVYRQEAAGIWSWGPAIRLPFLAVNMISVTAHGEGNLSVFGITKGSTISSQNLVRADMGPTSFAGSYNLGGEDLRAVVAKQSLDGRLELFVKGGNEVIYHRYEYATGQLTEFLPLGPPVRGPITVAVDGPGRFQVIWRRRASAGQANLMQHVFQVARNGGWDNLAYPVHPGDSADSQGPIVAVSAPDGRVGLFEYNDRTKRLYFSLLTSSEANQEPHWSDRELIHQFPQDDLINCSPGLTCSTN